MNYLRKDDRNVYLYYFQCWENILNIISWHFCLRASYFVYKCLRICIRCSYNYFCRHISPTRSKNVAQRSLQALVGSCKGKVFCRHFAIAVDFFLLFGFKRICSDVITVNYTEHMFLASEILKYNECQGIQVNSQYCRYLPWSPHWDGKCHKDGFNVGYAERVNSDEG